MARRSGGDGGCGCIILLVIIAIPLSLLWDLINGPLGFDKARKPEPPKAEVFSADTATVLVAGSEGGTYQVKWEDDSKTVKGVRRGKIGSRPTAYRLNISGAPSDGSDTLRVTAGKTEAWEGDFDIVLKVGDRFAGCDGTSDVERDTDAVYIFHTLGEETDGFLCRTSLW